MPKVLKRIDMLGQKCGRWTVLKIGTRTKRGMQMWQCVCECGTMREVRGPMLRDGTSSSCGCFSEEDKVRRSTRHGMSKSSEYRIWTLMKTRCYKKSNHKYRIYGARGIIVCERWKNSFENFLADMGKRPTPKHSIDRKNSDGNYEPGNCRWATAREQANNMRSNHIVQYCGKTTSLADAVRAAGSVVSASYAGQRILKLGWDVKRAIETPTKRVQL